MIAGDYKEKQRKTKSGKIKTDKIVTSVNGIEYAIGPKLGKGGVAKVFRARRLSDGKEFAFKEYVPSPERETIHKGIKNNIQTLINQPILDSDGTPLKSFIPPIELIELPASHGFGYIMELVDTDTNLPLKKLFHSDTRPDALIMCKIGENLSHLFSRLHLGTGWCYKDINEGNIYINPKTGDICIIDLDNISVPKTKTIKGTDGYMAPEVYVTSTPDLRTDQFSMAVYLYRLLVGGYPMDGKQTLNYLESTNQSVHEAADRIYGSNALFAFDPNDKRNEIRCLGNPAHPKYEKEYALQTQLWDDLPDELQYYFIKTFTTGLKKREARTTDNSWTNIFQKIAKDGLVKCRCGKYNFGSRDKVKRCMFCDRKLPMLPRAAAPVKQPVKKPVKTPVKQPVTTPVKQPVKMSELTTVVFKVKRDIEPQAIIVTAKRKAEMTGYQIHTELPKSNLMRIEYSPKRNALAAVNTSNIVWNVSYDDKKDTCAPGGRVILRPGLVMTIMHKKLQLKVSEVK